MKEYQIHVNSKTGSYIITGYGMKEKPVIGEDAELVYSFTDAGRNYEVYESRNTITYIVEKEIKE